MIDTEKLTFKKFCMTIGNLPSSYVESLSYYECLLWLCNYLENTVIPTVNNNAEAVDELQALFKQLHDYVYNYFDNLDVQDEIDHKLDEMVTDGTLGTLIGSYVDNYVSETNTRLDGVDSTLTSLDSRLDQLESEYTVIIGDSFIAEYPTFNWAKSLRVLLGLTSSNCLILGQGGAGFYKTGNQGTNWKDFLQAHISDIPDLNKVKRVIVGGGTNDVNAPDLNTLLTSVSGFHTYFKNTFPNAHLYVAEFGWFMKYDNVSSRKKINTIVIPAYKSFSTLERATYLNTELCYRDLHYYDTTQSSLVHPNDDGQRAIAAAINEALHGTYKVQYKKSSINFGTTDDITAANMTFSDYLINGIHNINLNGNFTLNKAYTPSSALTLDLGELTNQPFIRRSNDDILCFGQVTIRVVTSTAGHYSISGCYMYIDANGKYWLKIPAYAVNEDFTITSIIIQDNLSFDQYSW